MEHLNAEGDDVSDPLPFGMGRGPQFEILDPVVEPIPISMMNHFVRYKRPTEMDGHDQSMFPDPCDVSGQVAQLMWDRHVVVAVSVGGSHTCRLADRAFRHGIAGGEETLVMGGAESSGLVEPIAILNRTESRANSQRLLGCNSSPQQPQVMAMAITPRLGVSEAIRCHASGM